MHQSILWSSCHWSNCLQVSYKLLAVVKFIKHGSSSIHCAYWDIDTLRTAMVCILKKIIFKKVLVNLMAGECMRMVFLQSRTPPRIWILPKGVESIFYDCKVVDCFYKALFILKSQLF